MGRWIIPALIVCCSVLRSQAPVRARPSFDAFEVATVKPVEADAKSGRLFRMEGTRRWIAMNYTLQSLIALAFDLNPRAISGGPAWMTSQHYTIEAVCPGDVAPTRPEQMKMLRALVLERFAVKFHRQQKEMSMYDLTVARGGPKFAPAKPGEEQRLIAVVFPGKVEVPARNVTMDDFVAMLQRATLDRPVVNHTGLTGAFDFTLDWAPDETQYGGDLPKTPEDTPLPSLSAALEEQLGLKLTSTRGPVQVMTIDAARQPIQD